MKVRAVVARLPFNMSLCIQVSTTNGQCRIPSSRIFKFPSRTLTLAFGAGSPAR
jgi:hypothetical protein